MMTPEELQLLSDMVSALKGAGDGAFWVLVLWVAKGYFHIIAVSLVVTTVAVLLFRFAGKAMAANRYINSTRK